MSKLSTQDETKVEKAIQKDVSASLPTSSRHHRDDTPSWRAPATMLCSLLLGFGIALAQHFTYLSLDKQPVSDVSLSQAWVARISTGLAFAAKVALTVCVGTAYVQHQWLRFQQTPFNVAEIDKVTGVLGNIFCFLESTVWYRYPMLAFMALIVWCVT